MKYKYRFPFEILFIIPIGTILSMFMPSVDEAIKEGLVTSTQAIEINFVVMCLIVLIGIFIDYIGQKRRRKK